MQQGIVHHHLERLPVLRVLEEIYPGFGIIANLGSKKLTGGSGAVVVGADVARIGLAMLMEEKMNLMTTVDLGLPNNCPAHI